MADTVTRRYIYPPNWDETYEDNQPGHKQYIIRLTGVCDGTGQTDVSQVPLDMLKAPDGTAGTKLRVDRIQAVNNGYTNVTLEFDRTADAVIAVIGDTMTMDQKFEGGLVDNETGDTGDIVLTTTGNTSGDSYDITITFRVK